MDLPEFPDDLKVAGFNPISKHDVQTIEDWRARVLDPNDKSTHISALVHLVKTPADVESALATLWEGMKVHQARELELHDAKMKLLEFGAVPMPPEMAEDLLKTGREIREGMLEHMTDAARGEFTAWARGRFVEAGLREGLPSERLKLFLPVES